MFLVEIAFWDAESHSVVHRFVTPSETIARNYVAKANRIFNHYQKFYKEVFDVCDKTAWTWDSSWYDRLVYNFIQADYGKIKFVEDVSEL
jgi:hypothetical protein